MLKTKTIRKKGGGGGVGGAEQATAKPSSMKDPNHYISFLIRFQKLISQWVISIKRGFARQVVKYLRGNLSPQETWQTASARQEGRAPRKTSRVLREWLDLAPVAARDERYCISSSPIT